MTKDRLKKYKQLQKEYELLDERILSLELSSGDSVVDIVRGSSEQFPYKEQKISIRGYGSDKIPRLYRRRADCVAEMEAIEKFIDEIEDTLVWQLFTMKYIQGHTLKQAAVLTGYSERHTMRIINNFFDSFVCGNGSISANKIFASDET